MAPLTCEEANFFRGTQRVMGELSLTPKQSKALYEHALECEADCWYHALHPAAWTLAAYERDRRRHYTKGA